MVDTPLYQHRKALGLSLEQVCVELGQSPKSKGKLSQIERGDIDASLELALEIEIWSGGAVPASSLSKKAADLAERRSRAVAADEALA